MSVQNPCALYPFQCSCFETCTATSRFRADGSRASAEATSAERSDSKKAQSAVDASVGAAGPAVTSLQGASFTRTLRLKAKPESCGWLNAAAIEVNQVFNYCNETSLKAATRTDRLRKWMSGFDLCYLTAGATDGFEKIGADTIQSVCVHYAAKRRAAKRLKLRWRVSRGARRSLGWVPFKAASLKRCGGALRFAGKTFRVFERERLEGMKWKAGCFAQDACGDWWLCLPVEMAAEQAAAPHELVGIDLGLKDIAVTSDGERLEAGRWTHSYAGKLAMAQRRGHKRQAKRIHRKAARCRADALHKFSRSVVDRYQTIVVGDVSSVKLAKTQMAKSVLDAGWGMLKAQLQYKGEYAGRSVHVVNERNTSRTCSSCGSLSGPKGVNGLRVREWTCSECGDSHDRDVNAARNIVALGSRCRTSVRGNEPSLSSARRAGHHRPCETGISAKVVVARAPDQGSALPSLGAANSARPRALSRIARPSILLAALACLAAPAANAWDCPAGYTDTSTGCVAPATPVTQEQGQAQGQQQGQTQGQHQSATGGVATAVGGAGGNATGGASSQTQSADNAGNAQSTSYSESYSTPRQTPVAVAGFVQPTSSCLNAINGGASAPIAGLSFGFGHKDTAREFYEMGRPDLAIELLCTSAAAKHLKNCVYVPPVVAQAPAQPTPQYVTERQLQAVEQRILQKEVEK